MALHKEKCKALVERDKRVIAPTQHLSYYPLVVQKIDRDVIYDEDGNPFIDFLSSASSLNLGSCNPVVTAAAREQLEKYSQYTIAYTYSEKSIAYAERLTSVYPGGVPAKIVFGNCGSDANDAAVKFARAYTGRSKVITFINAYHGSTYGSISMSMVTTRMRAKMGPMLPDIYCFPYYDSSYDDATCERECVADIERAFATYLPADEVAAVVIEPVQGDAGLLAAHPVFMKKLYALCKKHGILFISEEVQQAFYRTGKFFSIEHYEGIIPDGIIMGKSIGAGFPLGGFMARAEIMDCLPAPAHLFTLGGNAMACAAGVAAFDYMQSEEFRHILAENTKVLEECVAELRTTFPDVITKVQGVHMSCGLAVTKKDAAGNDVPDADGTFKILYRAYERGLLVISLAGNVLRIQPPLDIRTENMKKGFAILKESVRDYVNGDIPDSVMEFRAGW